MKNKKTKTKIASCINGLFEYIYIHFTCLVVTYLQFCKLDYLVHEWN